MEMGGRQRERCCNDLGNGDLISLLVARACGTKKQPQAAALCGVGFVGR